MRINERSIPTRCQIFPSFDFPSTRSTFLSVILYFISFHFILYYFILYHSISSRSHLFYLFITKRMVQYLLIPFETTSYANQRKVSQNALSSSPFPIPRSIPATTIFHARETFLSVVFYFISILFFLFLILFFFNPFL